MSGKAFKRGRVNKKMNKIEHSIWIKLIIIGIVICLVVVIILFVTNYDETTIHIEGDYYLQKHSGNWILTNETNSHQLHSINSTTDLKNVILPEIIEYKSNNNHIIVQTRFSKKQLIDILEWPSRSFGDTLFYYPLTTTQYIDSLIEHDIYFNKLNSNLLLYWIIDLESNKILKALTEIEFKYKRKELKVSPILKFDYAN